MKKVVLYADIMLSGHDVSNELLQAMGELIPFFVDGNFELKQFWTLFHAQWKDEVSIWNYEGDLYMIGESDNWPRKEVLRIKLKIK